MTSTQNTTPDGQHLGTCKVCGDTVSTFKASRNGMLHDSLDYPDHEPELVPADGTPVAEAAETLAAETADHGHRTVAAYGEVIDVNEAIDHAMGLAGIPAAENLAMVGPVIDHADRLLAAARPADVDPIAERLDSVRAMNVFPGLTFFDGTGPRTVLTADVVDDHVVITDRAQRSTAHTVTELLRVHP